MKKQWIISNEASREVAALQAKLLTVAAGKPDLTKVHADAVVYLQQSNVHDLHRLIVEGQIEAVIRGDQLEWCLAQLQTEA